MLTIVLAAATTMCPFPERGVPIGSKRDLPPGAVAAFGALAEKGEPFQVSDALPPGPRLPFSRFVSAEGRGCELVLHYEHGGIGHSWLTARLRYAGGRWTVFP